MLSVLCKNLSEKLTRGYIMVQKSKTINRGNLGVISNQKGYLKIRRDIFEGQLELLAYNWGNLEVINDHLGVF